MSARKSPTLRPAGAQTQRERIWTQIRKVKKFTASAIQDRTGIAPTTIQTYLEGLAAAGYIAGSQGGKRAAFGRFGRRQWRLVKDCGIDAPAVTRQGKETAGGRSTLHMWRAMKALPEFDYRMVAYHASTEKVVVTWDMARRYVAWLARVGYLRTLAPRHGSRLAIYTLARNTGLKPPQIQRVKRVWDQNIGTVIEGDQSWKA